jgi:hypothetical protein
MAKPKKGVIPPALRAYVKKKKGASAKRTGPTTTMPAFLKNKLGRKRG